MERIFLDANVLFSAAFRDRAWFLDLWNLREVVLVTSPYAIREAERNLDDPKRIQRLDELLKSVERSSPSQGAALRASLLAPGLPDKDIPILAAAIEAGCDTLLTVDRADFGPLFGRKLGNLKVESVFEYLKRSRR